MHAVVVFVNIIYIIRCVTCDSASVLSDSGGACSKGRGGMWGVGGQGGTVGGGTRVFV